MTMSEKALMKIAVAKPWFSASEKELVLKAIDSGWVTQGPMVREFEQAIAAYTGAKHAIAVNSCTSALLIGLKLFGVKEGDEVIIPSYTFIATANAVVHCGAKPVFADIDPISYNMDPAALEKLITPRTKVIMPVDQVGLPADLGPILKIAKKHGLPVLEDAACGIGAEYDGQRLGGISDISCFSFHPRKVITSGEGGMITTSSDDLAARARVLISHGASISDLARHSSKTVVIEEYREFGYNFRMSDVQAALGLAQFRRLDEILQRKRYFAERYTSAFESMPEIRAPFDSSRFRTNYQSYLVRLNSPVVSRDEFMERLLARGVSTRRGIMAIHQEPAFLEKFGPVSLPVTEAALRETVILPLYPQMTEEEHDYVLQSIKEVLAGK